MLSVACVLRSGGDFDAEYVARLRDGVAAHLSLPHRFACLSDVDVPCERIPLVTDWPGWLGKLELFRPGLFDGPVLYLDLDSIAVGPLDAIASHPHRFSMLSDFYSPQHPASGVMAWCGDYSHIFTGFRDDLVPEYRTFSPHRGDCGWIVTNVGHQVERLQDIAPGAFGSFKAGVPSTASIVCFHGRPRPRDVGWSVEGAGNSRFISRRMRSK